MGSLSGLLGLALVGTSIVALFAAAPLHLIGRPGLHSSAQIVQLVAGLGSPLWIAIGLGGLWAARLQRGGSLISSSTALTLEEAIPGFRHSMPPGDVGVRLQGEDGLEDTGAESLHSTPFAVYGWDKGAIRKAIILPARFWARFRKHPAALNAVLAHELSHFLHRDVFLIYGLRDVARVSLAVAAICIIASIAASVAIDVGDSAKALPSIAAALVGKAYLVGCLVAIGVAWYLIGKLEAWREALADHRAEKVCGREPLLLAEALIEAREPDAAISAAGRPDVRARRNAIALRSMDIALAAAATSTLASVLAGNLLQLASVAPWLSGSPELVSRVLEFGTPVAILAICTFDERAVVRGWLASRALLCALGWSAGYLAVQTLPLIASSTFMPENFDKVVMHDAYRLFISDVVTTTLAAAWATSLALVGAWAAIRWHSLLISAVPSAVWLVASELEITWWPMVFDGWGAPVVTVLTLAVVVFAGKPQVRWTSVQSPALVALALLVAAYWAGLGKWNHLSRAATSAASLSLALGDSNAAYVHLSRAAKATPFAGSARLQMALIAHDRQDWKATSADADAAFNAPYLSAWEDLFDALVAAGDAGLATRTPESLALARDRIARAENLWRKNSRLPTKAAAGMLYNSACVGVLRGESHTFIAPRLLEAFMLDPSLIQDAHGDEDLKPLRLLAQPYPKESTVDLLHSNRYVDAPTTEDLIRTGKLSEEELVRLVALIVQTTKP